MLDQNKVIKIIDFGACSVAGVDELTDIGKDILGTAQFTAPEYYLGHQGSARSDIFSLGIIAYKMLSAKLPYGNHISNIRTPRDLQKLRYKSLRDENPAIPAWVDDAIRTATHPDPYKRYHEVSEFVYELGKPSATYLSKTKPPLIERDPVRFWQCLSVILGCVVIYQFSR